MNLQELKTGTSVKDAGDVQLVLFMMSGSEFGIEIRQVREINRVVEITRVPKAPDFLEGIMNLRGRIIPVVDLKKRFKLPFVETTNQTRIMIAEVGDQWVGLWVDRVTEVLKVPTVSVAAAPPMVLTIAGEYLSGILETKGRLVILLNLPRILKLEEIRALAEAEAAEVDLIAEKGSRPGLIQGAGDVEKNHVH